MHIFFTTFFALAGSFLLGFSAHAGTIDKVSEAACTEMKAQGVLKEQSPVPCHRLRTVNFSYLGFDGKTHHDGEIMVLDAAAKHVRNMFAELLQGRFPIERARLMHHYGGDDARSMRDNNTSGFNHRPLTDGDSLSLHAYGLAIDINPLQNPYLAFGGNGTAWISPEGGHRYLNRAKHRPGKDERQGMAEDIVQVFAKHGFLIWGGDWDDPIDYQHFQVSRKLAEQLTSLPAREAQLVFDRHVEQYRACIRSADSKSQMPPNIMRCRHSK